MISFHQYTYNGISYQTWYSSVLKLSSSCLPQIFFSFLWCYGVIPVLRDFLFQVSSLFFSLSVQKKKEKRKKKRQLNNLQLYHNMLIERKKNLDSVFQNLAMILLKNWVLFIIRLLKRNFLFRKTTILLWWVSGFGCKLNNRIDMAKL